MPLIKIDYNQNVLDAEKVDALIQLLLKKSMQIYTLGEDAVSVFTSKYGEHYHSTAAAEVEIRAGVHEYDKPDISKSNLRTTHLAEYKTVLTKFIQSKNIAKGIVLSITFEDWKVEFLPGNG